MQAGDASPAFYILNNNPLGSLVGRIHGRAKRFIT